MRLFGDLRSDPVGSPLPECPPWPGLLGRCLEALLSEDERRAGAHHTPHPVAERVVDLALDGANERAPTVCDPAVGGGAFLLAAADRLHRDGLDRTAVLDRLWGFDVDPLAVAVTEAGLALWAGGGGRSDRLVIGDFLSPTVADAGPRGGWSLVVGNPPFQSQLAGRTARNRARAQQLRGRFGAVAGGYVDTAGLFLLAGVEHLADGGRAALVVPASLLAATDAAPLRRAVVTSAPLRAVWVPDGQPFDAAVDVVVPVVERSGSGPVELFAGAPGPPMEVADPGPDWSRLLAAADGVPVVDLDPDAGVLGDRATVTAGFRRHFYALRAAVHEAEAGDGRPLLTVGLVDPLTSHWGRRPTRLGGMTYDAPVVDTDAVTDASVADWVRARHRPKVLVATQTRAVEVLVDPTGAAVPSTPLISAEPDDPVDLWRLAAVLCAPPVTAWLHARSAGGGLSRGRIRPAAGLLRQVPLPPDRAGWDGAALVVEEASAEPDPGRRRELLLEAGATLTTAYGAPAGVTAWWRGLLPDP